MTDRIPLDHLNSDQYDELCDQLEALRRVARGYCARAEYELARHADAEAADIAAGSYAGRAEELERQLRTSQWYRQDAERRVRCQRERAETAEAGQLLLARTIAATSKQTVEQVLADVRAALDGKQPVVPDGTSVIGPPPGISADEARQMRDELLAATRPAPLTPAEEARIAQDGVNTPGCDCGHDGMGVSWHADECPWRRSVVDCPGRPAPA